MGLDPGVETTRWRFLAEGQANPESPFRGKSKNQRMPLKPATGFYLPPKM